MQVCVSGATILRHLLENVANLKVTVPGYPKSKDLATNGVPPRLLGFCNGFNKTPSHPGYYRAGILENMVGLRPGTLGAMMHDDQTKLHIGSGTSL